jgi:hypothetical protein
VLLKNHDRIFQFQTFEILNYMLALSSVAKKRKNQLLESVKIFSTVETYFLKVSRSRLSIETRSSQIKTPKLRKNGHKKFFGSQ